MYLYRIFQYFIWLFQHCAIVRSYPQMSIKVILTLYVKLLRFQTKQSPAAVVRLQWRPCHFTLTTQFFCNLWEKKKTNTFRLLDTVTNRHPSSCAESGSSCRCSGSGLACDLTEYQRDCENGLCSCGSFGKTGGDTLAFNLPFGSENNPWAAGTRFEQEAVPLEPFAKVKIWTLNLSQGSTTATLSATGENTHSRRLATTF